MNLGGIIIQISFQTHDPPLDGMSYQDKGEQKGKIMQTRLHVPTEKEKYRHTLHIPRRKSQINS